MAFSAAVYDKALVSCARHCCICHRFKGLKIELHHIRLKSKGGKDTFENCIPLCFDCHGDQRSYDHKHPKGRKYSEKELRQHRDGWYVYVKEHHVRPVKNPAKDDAIKVDAKVSVGGSDTIELLGCPAVVVTLVCRSKRPARIHRVEARLRGYNPMAMFDRGFGGRLAYTPAPDRFRKNETTALQLIPLPSMSYEEQIVLQRDEIAKFAFPFAMPLFQIFLRNPKEKVSLSLVFMDETEKRIAGSKFHGALRALDHCYGDKPYPLLPAVRMTVHTTVAGKPKFDAAGTVNELPISLDAEGSSTPSVDERVQIIAGIFRAIWNNWMATKKLFYVVKPAETLRDMDLEGLKQVGFEVGLPPIISVLTLSELIALFQLIRDQIAEMKDNAGNQNTSTSQTHSCTINLAPSDQEILAVLPSIFIADPELGLIKANVGFKGES